MSQQAEELVPTSNPRPNSVPDEAAAAKAEVDKKPHVYNFKGEEFVFPPLPGQLPARAIRQFQRGEHLEAAYALLGEDEQRFDALNPSVDELTEFMEWFAKAYGFENVGESQASKDS
jgi:hypothetical protein